MSAVDSAPPAGQDRPLRYRRGPRRGLQRTVRSTEASARTTTAPQTADAPLALQPDSAAPITSSDPATTQSSNRGNHGRRGTFGRGGGRGTRRGGAQGGTPVQPMVNGRRTFGGQLSSSTNTMVTPGAGSLDGGAQVFIPGKAALPRVRGPQAPRTSRMSKSQAPDIATRTHEDITNGQYECVICTNEVLPNSKIWTCRTCWSVLHLSCVKRWSKNEVSTHQQQANENREPPSLRKWRCPGCNLPKDDLPDTYTCWCTKEVEPRSIAGLPPHSCGQTCSKIRIGSCPHPCELICHAGPCPSCAHMGPTLPCFCGKETSSRRCLETNYDSGWSCGQICGDVLPCGEHTCQQSCHEGLCGGCEIMIESRCYCGRIERPVPCSEREEERQSQLPHRVEDSSANSTASGAHGELETWMGSFNCGATCRRRFDCGHPDHYCERTCHVQDSTPAHCPLSPDVVTHCSCGKTPLDVLLPKPRVDCKQPIPHCEERCQKELPCGHLCPEICHGGDCRPCLHTITITCRCGRTVSDTVCHQGTEAPPSCTRICRSTLNCGRHECGERCCAGEKKASERQAGKRKHRALNSTARVGEDEFEAEHICLKVCGRPLKCGSHLCTELCHKGPCSSCLEAVFEEIHCACGRTTLHPPQPCGTRPPECRFECTRLRNCGHPQVRHQCHEDGESCPKCPFLMEKPCVCGKRTLKNQPCWFTEVKCGLPCGKRLKCGIHFCQKLCHRPGLCEDAASPCTQLCRRNKTVCNHTCSDPCHAPYPCKEIGPCLAKTFITCDCQRQKQEARCLAAKGSNGNLEKTLECNDECLKLQRNAKLAAALNIDLATHTDAHIPYSQQTLDMFKDNNKFCQSYEREFRVFAADESEKRLRFKPMQQHQRAFLHSLAEDFGLDSESQDPEPHRHVCLFKTPRFVSAPMKTLAQCIKIKPIATAEIALPATKGQIPTPEPFNAFLLSKPRFGLTIDELSSELQPEFSTAGVHFDISFLPSGEIVLKGQPSGSWHQKMESTLIHLKAAVSKKVKALNLAADVGLCHVDSSLNVARREDDHADGGWSRVAKGASASKGATKESFGAKSAFTVLGSKGAGKVKKEVVQDAVEDWEREVEGWDTG